MHGLRGSSVVDLSTEIAELDALEAEGVIGTGLEGA